MSLAVGCVDAPITPDQLEADGRLRPSVPGQSAFSAQEGKPSTQQAARIEAMLSDAQTGPTVDAASFPADVGTIHLHLGAEGLSTARPVVFRWTHEGDSIRQPGLLAPTASPRHAARLHIDPLQTGTWTVEVLETGSDAVLWQRRFEVVELPTPVNSSD